MAVTPNYSWPIPVATDYVKDGYDAIADLGNAIDTTVAGLPSGSFTYVGGATFTTQSSVSINNCFTSTYANYKVLINITAATSSGTAILRMRAAGTDNSSADYKTGFLYMGVTGAGAFGNVPNTTVSGVVVGAPSTTYGAMVNLDIFSPQQTAYTGMIHQLTGENLVFGSCKMTVTTAYDGLTFVPDSGTVSGTIRVYGYANS